MMKFPGSGSPIFLWLGTLCTLVAVAMGGRLWYQQHHAAAPVVEVEQPRNPLAPAKPTIRKPTAVQDAAPVSAGVVADTSAPTPVRVTSAAAEAPREVQMTRLEARRQLKERVAAAIAQMPADLNDNWFAANFAYVPDGVALQSFYDSLLVLGEQLTAARERQMKLDHQRISRDPGLFLGRAREAMYATPLDSARLVDEVKGNLAVALFLELKLSDGLADAQEPVLNALFKGLEQTYLGLARLAVAQDREPTEWVAQRLRVLEAGALDRYQRLDRLRRQAEAAAAVPAGRGRRREEVPARALPPDPQQVSLNRSLDRFLTQLGKLYTDLASTEVDEDDRAANTTRAFAILAMAQRRTGSESVLSALVRVTDLQRAWWFRQARINWRQAQLAVARGDGAAASQAYALAIRYYESYLATAVGPDRDRILAEQQVLMQEIAGLRAADADATPRSGATAQRTRT